MFPPPDSGTEPPQVQPSELKVLSISPSGKVDRAARVSLSFNSPMIRVSAPAESADSLGITLEPRPKGSWRWLGSQTLAFEPAAGQMPRATEFVVTVPKGIKDVNGTALGQAYTERFKLPRPAVVSARPSGKGLALEPLIVVSFNQPVDPETTPAKVHLKLGSSELGLKSLTFSQAKELDPETSKSYSNKPPDSVLFFKPAQPLKPGSTYSLEVEKGVKSLEGPLLGSKRWSRSFSTYDPLALWYTRPSQEERDAPLQDLYIIFNNDLDRKAFEPEWVTVEPPIEGMKIKMHGPRLWLSGATKGLTDYRVTISPKLKDRFGQTLGKPLTVVFKTTRSFRCLAHDYHHYTLLDANSKPILPVFTSGVDRLEVEVHQVTPADWQRFNEYFQWNYHRYSIKRSELKKPEPRCPGEPIGTKVLKIQGDPNSVLTNAIDLSEFLENGVGNLIVTVSDPDNEMKSHHWRKFTLWVQVTRLGLDLETSNDKSLLLVTDLKDGRPLAGAKVSAGEGFQLTDSAGIAVLDNQDGPGDPGWGPPLLVESDLGDCFVPWSARRKKLLEPNWNWFLFDDRGLYKPGEKVYIKGYVRNWQRGPKGRLTTPGKTGYKVSWTLQDPLGKQIRKGLTKVNEFGGIDVSFELPDNTNLGEHKFRVSGDQYPDGGHTINVQEFRRPEFEVTTKTESKGPHILEGTATVKATAAYYSGGGLPDSKVDWKVTTSSANYTPPGRSDYTFGRWVPWWDLGPWWRGRVQKSKSVEHQGWTDDQGSHTLRLNFESMHPPAPTNVTVTAAVADVNRQRQSGSTTILMHPSERYVGLKSAENFSDEDSDLEVEAVVTDIDGALLPGIPINIQLLKLEYQQMHDGYRQVERLVSQKEVTSSASRLKLKFATSEGGSYKVRAEVLDKAGRPNRTEYNLWKAGGRLPSSDKVEVESLTLVPTRKEYEPGETARILVMAPFSEGTGVVVWRRDGIESHQPFQVKNGTATIERPVTEELIPYVRARVTAVGATEWGTGIRPAVASGALELSISTASRKLAVEVLPSQQQLEPGAEVEVEVQVKDHLGQPVKNSEVTLWVADEALLALVGYKTPDLLSSFYEQRPEETRTWHSRESITLGARKTAEILRRASGISYFTSPDESFGSLDDLDAGVEFSEFTSNSEQEMGVPFDPSYGFDATARIASSERAMTARGLLGLSIQVAAPKKFAIRKNFNPLALFKGQLATDSRGRTKVKVKLPDNLTRYRVMAVAVEGSERFGSSDQRLTARLPLQVRPSLPRFLNFGDKTTLPVVIQNQTEEPLSVKVVGQAEGVEWLGPAGKQVEVPAKDRVEVQFQARANQVGQAHFRFGVVAGEYSDASTKTLPVYTPATGAAFATYGSLAEDGAINQPVQRPSDVWTQFGGLQVSLSSTALSELSDAFLYLYEYKYECTEQRASRLLGIAVMADVVSAFNLESMPKEAYIKVRAKSDILTLVKLQNKDGGWEYWRRRQESVPFVSIHVAHALARAKAQGFAVEAKPLELSLKYLAKIEQHCAAEKYGIDNTRALTAYALYVRNLLGDPDLERTKALFQEVRQDKKLNLEALGWLWPTLSQHAKDSSELKELRRLVRNRATQTANSAQFSKGYQEANEHLILHSSRRTDAILLGALLADQPEDQLSTKLVRGLLSHRVKGRWDNTQENIWVLLALQSYFRTYEKENPNLTGQLWLGDDFLGQESFRGRTAKEAQLKVPMATVPTESTPLLVGKTGPGRLYYRVGLDYAPKSLRLEAQSRGFTVERTMRGVDNADDVRQLENGDWTLKAGAKVEITLTMIATERRYHVALVDQLAAGLEPLNPVLEGTPSSSRPSRWERWYEHENLRDERVEAFTQSLYPGVYTYKYEALATTPGEYILPSAKAEEMYSPEVYGRTASGRLIVEK